MATRPMQSEVDHAFKRFQAWRVQIGSSEIAGGKLTESDTRSKLIDPIFKKILGWGENDIRREEPVASGYVDYIFGSDFPYFHVEAKRSTPRFQMAAKSRARILQIDGPHLLRSSNKILREGIQQAARYAFDLGTDFTVLTNGPQFIVFKTRISGKSWKSGKAVVWHDFDDIEADFPRFYDALARENVRSGSLHQLFQDVDSVTRSFYLPLARVRNPDAELVRNKYWGKISKYFGPLLDDRPENNEIQDEILRHCYVSTPISDQADKEIDSLLRDGMPPFLTDSKFVDIKRAQSRGTAFDYAFESDIKGSKPATYLLTGGVGSGKTTFLKRFATISQPTLLKHYCVWIHVDFLPLGKVSVDEATSHLEEYTYAEIRRQLNENYKDLVPIDGEKLRELFSLQIAEYRKTRLFGIVEGSEKWNEYVNEIVDGLFQNDYAFVEAILRQARTRGRRPVLILDNTDQLGEAFQGAVFLFAQRMAKDLSAFTVVALREEKYFAAYRRGIFDAYGERRFHIGSPQLSEVIATRLERGLSKYMNAAGGEEDARIIEEHARVERLIKCFIRSATSKNQNIVRMLACVANSDIRHALGFFREFVSSGNTDLEKIIRTIDEHGNYVVPFHEFAKSAMLGSRRYFRSDKSHIVNLFSASAAPQASHLTACRILARLSSARGAASQHGEGFVDTTRLLAEFRRSFGSADDFLEKGKELLSRDLLESEPPRSEDIDHSDAIRISAGGAYYWQFLARSFAYLDLVFIDTPIADEETASNLAQMADAHDLTTRFKRVRLFLDYLNNQELAEIKEVSRRGGDYSTSLIVEIKAQIEKEILVICGKTGALDNQ